MQRSTRQVGIDVIPKYSIQDNGTSRFLIAAPGVMISKSEFAVVPQNSLARLTDRLSTVYVNSMLSV